MSSPSQINRNIFSFKHFQVEDAGGTIVIHVFGAYFGLAVAKVLGPPKDQANLNNTSGISDILSLVGTLFLWLFWPSFNGGAFTADPVQGGRAIANTVVGLLGSCTCTFMVSGIIGGKLTPADIQNATLAGGVAVGAVARMNIGLGWASICGSTGGILSTLGYQYIQPFLERKIGLYDTCGVNNLHGIPGIFGSVISCIFCVTAWESWMPWPKDQIGYYQLASLASTLGMALVTGCFTGYVVKFCKKLIKKISTPQNPTQSDLDNSVHFNDYTCVREGSQTALARAPPPPPFRLPTYANRPHVVIIVSEAPPSPACAPSASMRRYWKASEDVSQHGVPLPQSDQVQASGAVGHVVV